MNNTDQVLQLAIPLIKKYESFSAEAYPDPATGAEPITIGYGSTNAALPPGESFQMGDTIDEATAERWLSYEVENHIIPQLDQMIDFELLPNELAPVVDFCYNLGTGAFERSSMLKYINNDDFPNAQLEFLKWNKAGGHVMRGLSRRCLARATLFGGMSRQDLIHQCLGGIDPEH